MQRLEPINRVSQVSQLSEYIRKTGENLLQLHLYTSRPPVIYLSGSFMLFTHYAHPHHNSFRVYINCNCDKKKGLGMISQKVLPIVHVEDAS